MMDAQDAMDQHDAWDYNAEIKTILSKLGIHDTTKQIKNYRVDNKNVLFWLKR